MSYYVPCRKCNHNFKKTSNASKQELCLDCRGADWGAYKGNTLYQLKSTSKTLTGKIIDEILVEVDTKFGEHELALKTVLQMFEKSIDLKIQKLINERIDKIDMHDLDKKTGERVATLNTRIFRMNKEIEKIKEMIK